MKIFSGQARLTMRFSPEFITLLPAYSEEVRAFANTTNRTQPHVAVQDTTLGYELVARTRNVSDDGLTCSVDITALPIFQEFINFEVTANKIRNVDPLNPDSLRRLLCCTHALRTVTIEEHKNNNIRIIIDPGSTVAASASILVCFVHTSIIKLRLRFQANSLHHVKYLKILKIPDIDSAERGNAVAIVVTSL